MVDYEGVYGKVIELDSLSKLVKENNNNLIIRRIMDKGLDRAVDLLDHNLALTKDDFKIDKNNTDFRSRLSKILTEICHIFQS